MGRYLLGVESFFGLILAMLIVAIIPGPAVIAVMSLSLVSGFKRGASLTAGLVVADYIFIVLAVSGLTALIGAMGDAFRYINYACALYLVYLGLKLVLHKSPDADAEPVVFAERSDFVTGLIITLSNPKAILFYAALFPAFVDPAQLTLLDVLLIMLSSTLVFGSVNLVYAWLGMRSKSFIKPGKGYRIANRVSGSALIVLGAMIGSKN